MSLPCRPSRGWFPFALRLTSNSFTYVRGSLRPGPYFVASSHPLLRNCLSEPVQFEKHMMSPSLWILYLQNPLSGTYSLTLSLLSFNSLGQHHGLEHSGLNVSLDRLFPQQPVGSSSTRAASWAPLCPQLVSQDRAQGIQGSVSE